MIKLIQSAVEIDGNVLVSVNFIFAVVAVIASIYNMVSSSKKNNKQEIEGIIKANLKLDQLCASLNATSLDIREMKSQMSEMRDVQVKHELRLQHVEKKVEEL